MMCCPVEVAGLLTSDNLQAAVALLTSLLYGAYVLDTYFDFYCIRVMLIVIAVNSWLACVILLGLHCLTVN